MVPTERILARSTSLGRLAAVLIILAAVLGQSADAQTGGGLTDPRPFAVAPMSVQSDVVEPPSPGPLSDPGLDLRSGPVDVPLELRIPALQINAPVLGVGITAENVMDAPKGLAADPVWQKAFWYRGGGIPGDVGTATLAGHVDDVLGRPAVFARLRDLRSGDQIAVHDTRTGLDVRFTVVKTATYSVQQAADPAVLAQIYGSGPISGRGPQPAPDGLSHLTLITCTGGFVNGSYDRRLVVYATRSESKQSQIQMDASGIFGLGRWIVALLALALAPGNGDGLANAEPPSPQPLAASPTVGAITDGLLLEWHAPLPDLTRRADGTVAVNTPGYAQTDTPGMPQLPLTSEVVALPPGARPTIEIIRAEETDLPLPGLLLLSPRPAGVQRDVEGNVIGGAFAESTDTPCLEAKGCPEKFDQPVTLTLLGTLRGVSLARLSFFPVRPVANQLRVTTHIQVVLKFNTHASEGETSRQPPSGLAHLDPLLDVLKRTVINPEQARTSQLPSAPSLPVSAMAPQQTGARRAILSVTQPGLTAVSYAGLAAIGFPLAGIEPQLFHLTRAGTEIAMQWDGNGNSVFEPGERLLFIADPRFSRWANSDVYYLSVGDRPGLRMRSRPASPAPQLAGTAWLTKTYETNALYTPGCYCGRIPPGRDGDRWAWDDVRRPDRAHPSYDFGAFPALDTTQPATFTLWLIGYTDLPNIAPDHRVDVSLNGIGLGRIEWDGRQAITATFAVTPGVLAAANNVLSLNLPGVGSIVEGVWLDGFELRYARGNVPAGSSVFFSGDGEPRTYTLGLTSTAGLRGYDVTNPENPVSLLEINPSSITVTDPASSGTRRYLLASAEAIQPPARMRLATELQPVSGADYLILSPSLFLPALADLIALRQSQGLMVAVEDLQAIYDAYDGRPTPAAIHTYLQSAYTTWDPRPTYVLLVGDGTFDPKRYRADSKETFLPPYLADVDPWMGETAADNRYALLDGGAQGGGDILPDLLVGRLPVNTIAETQIVVNKIVRYETDPYPGGWNGNVVFVADAADAAGDFAGDSDQLASEYIRAPLSTRKVYFVPPTTSVADTHQAILESWNAGAGLVMYNGHSSVRQWAAERLFHRDDVASLHNASRLPVVLELTCFTGLFHEPGGTTLDETLLRAADGGAIAVWGPTGLGVATGHQQLAQGFLASLLQRQETTIGAGTLSGKLKLLASGSSALDLVDTFTLLGDPAMRMNLTLNPWASNAYLPLIQR